jgi:hypothetical protein
LSTIDVPLTNGLSNIQIEYIRELVDKIWEKYDSDDSGALDKIETANFLNEILTV